VDKMKDEKLELENRILELIDNRKVITTNKGAKY